MSKEAVVLKMIKAKIKYLLMSKVKVLPENRTDELGSIVIGQLNILFELSDFIKESEVNDNYLSMAEG